MVTVDWENKIINIPQSYLTLVSGALYTLDTDQLRLDLKALEASVEGMPFEDTHRHNTQVTISGVTYARTIEFINGYTVTFEDGQYAVNLEGSNNNILDVLNRNQVSVASQNSAGLIVTESPATLTDANVVSVDGIPVTSPNDFKADIAPLL